MPHSKSHANQSFRSIMIRYTLPSVEDRMVQPCPAHSTGNHPDNGWIKITHDGPRWRVSSLRKLKVTVWRGIEHGHKARAKVA